MKFIFHLFFAYYVLSASASYCQFNSVRKFIAERDSFPIGFDEQYIFDSSGLFFNMKIGEWNSFVSCGKYLFSKDSILLDYVYPEQLNPILKTEELPPVNDSIIDITINTRYGAPLKAYVDLIEDGGRFLKEVQLDSTGTIQVNIKRYKSVRLSFLDHFYHKWIYVDLKTKSLTVTLSYPEIFFYNNHPNTLIVYKPIFLYSNDKLWDLNGYRFTEEK